MTKLKSRQDYIDRRKELGLTIEDICLKTGVNQDTVELFESGQWFETGFSDLYGMALREYELEKIQLQAAILGAMVDNVIEAGRLMVEALKEIEPDETPPWLWKKIQAAIAAWEATEKSEASDG